MRVFEVKYGARYLPSIGLVIAESIEEAAKLWAEAWSIEAWNISPLDPEPSMFVMADKAFCTGPKP